jgi:hypothetical protein
MPTLPLSMTTLCSHTTVHSTLNSRVSTRDPQRPTLNPRERPPKMSTATTSFLNGWRTLPDELKLEILRYALPCDETFKSLQFSKAKIEERQDKSPNRPLARWVWMFQSEVVPLLTCSETRDLAPEAFYSQNTMELDQFAWMPLQYSPPSIRPHIRSIKMNVMFHNKNGIARLEKLATISHNLPNLRSIEVEVKGNDSKVEALASFQEMAFNTKQLRVLYRHHRQNPHASIPEPTDPCEMALLSLLTVLPRGKDVQQRLERLSYPDYDPIGFRSWTDRQGQLVEEWPERQPGKQSDRMTRKIIWI